MPHYIAFFTYAKSAWRGMVEHPEDREEAARKVIEAAGGRLLSFYWMLSDHDGFSIFEAADAVAAAAVSAAVSASGRISDVKTVRLLDKGEVRRSLEAAKVIATVYEPPGGFMKEWRAEYDVLGEAWGT
jgi:uncharacterized protein with GYD domain